MSARGILSNPGLYAGHQQTPRECIQRWLNITAQADTDITYQAMHHHLSFMAESMLSKTQRVTFNGLSKDKRLVVDFLREHFQLEPRPCDHPPKLACTFDDGAFRKRAQADGRSAVGDGKGENGYASENTDGAFFKSMVDDLAKEDGDGGVDDVGVMGGLFGDEEI